MPDSPFTLHTEIADEFQLTGEARDVFMVCAGIVRMNGMTVVGKEIRAYREKGTCSEETMRNIEAALTKFARE